MTARSWLRRTDWLWMIIGGFYLIAYLFWYLPALTGLPRSAREPPGQFPWHWTLDFAATALSGGTLLFLGFRRATVLTGPRSPGADADSGTDRSGIGRATGAE